MMRECQDLSDDLLMFALNLTKNDNKKAHSYISVLLESNDIIGNDTRERQERIRSSAESKSVTYVGLSPELQCHPMYTKDCLADDSLRMVLTRLRTSSHRLRIETGRWARTPREARLCSCGAAVQDERHTIVDCPQVHHIREKFGKPNIDFVSFLNDMPSKSDLCLINDILKFFADNTNNPNNADNDN